VKSQHKKFKLFFIFIAIGQGVDETPFAARVQDYFQSARFGENRSLKNSLRVLDRADEISRADLIF
jgi:hypothetical protein